jgi:hypothetical protein
MVKTAALLVLMAALLGEGARADSCPPASQICVARSWSVGEDRGVGGPMPTRLEAEESARASCRAFVKSSFPSYPVDYCDNQITFKCETSQAEIRRGHVCRARSWSVGDARGIGLRKPTELEARESAREACRAYVQSTFPSYPAGYCDSQVDLECVETVL